MIYLSFKNMVEDDAQRFIVANFEDGTYDGDTDWSEVFDDMYDSDDVTGNASLAGHPDCFLVSYAPDYEKIAFMFADEEIGRKFNQDSVNMIKRVKYDNPWAIVWWKDGQVTRSKCAENDVWSESAGFNACVAKRYFQTAGAYNKVLKTYCTDVHNDKVTSWQDGYNTGYADGREDGYYEGREDGYDEGFEDGQNYERQERKEMNFED